MALVKIMPLAVDGIVGAADGYLSVHDTLKGRADAWGKPLGTNGYQSLYGIWADVGALAGGIFLGMQRFNSDVADSLVQSGAALLGRRLGVGLARNGASGQPPGAPTATPRFVAGNYMPQVAAGNYARQGQYVSTRQKPRILS